MLNLIHHLPILTTIISALFAAAIFRRWRKYHTGPHLLWWLAGITAYGLGTGIESAITLFGNSVVLNKAWYIAGAIFGGYPLAQGTVYLLLKRKTANVLTAITIPFVVIVSTLVILSPVDHSALDADKPAGAILAWKWVRLCTPFINLYAVIFLVGGAILSAIRYRAMPGMRHRAVGNTLIAAGAILPGIGGALTKAGYVEALYVGELIGIVLIWMGYSYCVRK